MKDNRYEGEETRNPHGWHRCVLSDFTNVVMGQSPSSKTYNQSGDGLPFFQGKAEFGDVYPVISMYCSQPKKIAKRGATLLSVRAPVGPTNLIQHDCCIGRGLVALHPCGGMQSKFLFYLLRSIEPVISRKGISSPDMLKLSLRSSLRVLNPSTCTPLSREQTPYSCQDRGFILQNWKRVSRN